MNIPATKSGYLKKHSNAMLGESWKSVKCDLHQDGSFLWFKDSGTCKGNVNLKNVCRFITVGPNVRSIPYSPAVPSYGRIECMIAFPETPSKKSKIHFFLASDDQDFNSWMTAIMSVLPPPPPQQPPPSPNPGYAHGYGPPPGPPTATPFYPQPGALSMPTPGPIGFEGLSGSAPSFHPSAQPPPYQPYPQQQQYPQQSYPYQQQPQGNYPPPPPPGYYQPSPAPGYAPAVSGAFYQQPAGSFGAHQQPSARTEVVYVNSPSKGHSSHGTGKMLAGVAGGAVAGYAASRLFHPFGGFGGGYGGYGWGHGSWGSGSWGSFSGGSFGSFGGCD